MSTMIASCYQRCRDETARIKGTWVSETSAPEGKSGGEWAWLSESERCRVAVSEKKAWRAPITRATPPAELSRAATGRFTLQQNLRSEMGFVSV